MPDRSGEVGEKEALAQAMWRRQVAPLNVCRQMAPRVLAALEDVATQGSAEPETHVGRGDKWVNPDAPPFDMDAFEARSATTRSGRTVVALYDRLDLVRGAKASEVEAIWIEQVEAMRECIDRLRSGWYSAEDDDGESWWWRDDPQDRGVECEPMTEAQRAVMEQQGSIQ